MEIWKPVVNLPGYEISSLGNLRNPKGKFLKLRKKEKGYLVFPFRRKNFRIHQLVANAFLGECPEGYQINHKNNNPADNRVENLEYVTIKENTLHRSRPTRGSASVMEIPRIKRHQIEFRNITEEQLREIRSAYYSSSTLTIRQLANQYEMSIGKMSNILNS